MIQARYIVLKMGRRSFTLVSIHPDGHKQEAIASCNHTAATQKLPCVVAVAIHHAGPNNELVERAKKGPDDKA